MNIKGGSERWNGCGSGEEGFEGNSRFQALTNWEQRLGGNATERGEPVGGFARLGKGSSHKSHFI